MPKRRRTINWRKAERLAVALVAIWGAGLSTYQVVSQHAEKARRLKVEVSWDAPARGARQYRYGLKLVARNPGYQPVMLTAAGFLLPDGRLYPCGQTDLPRRLEPGENTGVLLAGESLLPLCEALAADGSAATVTLIGIYEDALDVHHRSAPFPFDIARARQIATMSQNDTGTRPGSGEAPKQ